MPEPKKGENKQDYISRCIKVRRKEHPEEKKDKSVAVCYSLWRTAKSEKK